MGSASGHRDLRVVPGNQYGTSRLHLSTSGFGQQGREVTNDVIDPADLVDSKLDGSVNGTDLARIPAAWSG